jgi:hypothetical protein
MEFKTEDFGGASFIVPDKPTVFQLADYDSRRYDLRGLPSVVILWEMAKALITEWESEAWPDLEADLQTEVDNPDHAVKLIQWAGTMVAAYRRDLDAISKNS